MRHLGERITDFVFGDLSAAEMTEARQHLADCSDCRNEVQQFERTYAMLKSSPDVDPPRHIVFESEKRSFAWKWLAPIGVAAALFVAVWIAAPMQVHWADSQVVISFGKTSIPAPPQAASVVPPPAPQPAVQPIDYDLITRQVQSRLAIELRNRDLQQAKTNQRFQDTFVYLKDRQESADKRGNENAAAIEMISGKTGAQD